MHELSSKDAQRGPAAAAEHARRPARPGAQTRGFTLFEVLIAMALSAILVAAVYTALSMHISRTQRAYADVEQTGVARGVLRKIGVDLRTALYQAAEAVPAQQGGGTQATNGGEQGTGGGSDPDQDPQLEQAFESATGELGLWGETDWVLFDVGVPMRRLMPNETSESDAGAFTAMRLVLYAIDEGTRDEPAALVRKEVSREQAELVAFDLRAISDAAELTEVLAQEVHQLTFRYYDGIEWSSSWDSSLMGGLPRAVEVTIGVQPLDDGQEDVPYRLVVALPTPSANRVQDDYQLLEAGLLGGP